MFLILGAGESEILFRSFLLPLITYRLLFQRPLALSDHVTKASFNRLSPNSAQINFLLTGWIHCQEIS